MNAKEQGFLLLTSQLGNPHRKPLTVPQFRTLASRVMQMEKPQALRELTQKDLLALGYDFSTAQRILVLLQDTQVLDFYLRKGLQWDCIPITRVSPAYPGQVRQRLGLDAPGCLWAKGDVTLLNTKTLSLVGSRDLSDRNAVFAKESGRQAAQQGITLVSGNARGADRVAQEACLNAGGNVICVVADSLEKYPLRNGVLYLSEDSYDLSFTSQRALSRNRVIHTLGYITLVAQSDLGVGGTWDGTVRNLQNGWSPVFCFDDGNSASRELEQMGATLITSTALTNLAALQPQNQTLI